MMDATAISLCMDHSLPIIVFGMEEAGNIKRVCLGESIGTVVSGKDTETKESSPNKKKARG